MKYNIKTILNDEEYLRQVSKRINLNDKNYFEYLKMLKECCLEDSNLLALASIQMGIPYRMIYLKITQVDKFYEENWDEAKILINPVIIRKTGLTRFWESCASCLDNMGLVERPYEIEVEYYDELGSKHKDIFNDFAATVLSHEYDHLDGIPHIDIALEIIDMPQEERKEYRKTHGYEILNKKGSFEELKKQKRLIR